jgi:hypothetical protein
LVYCPNTFRYVLNVVGKTYVFNVDKAFPQVGTSEIKALWMQGEIQVPDSALMLISALNSTNSTYNHWLFRLNFDRDLNTTKMDLVSDHVVTSSREGASYLHNVTYIGALSSAQTPLGLF